MESGKSGESAKISIDSLSTGQRARRRDVWGSESDGAMASASAATARADLLRWCDRVESRDRREAPPTPTLWNHEKVGKDVARARELHLAGGAVRKRVTHAPPPVDEAAAIAPGHGQEVTFHLVAYAVRPEAVDAPRDDGSDDGELHDGVPSGARLLLSTRADVAGGCGSPHRLILDDGSDAASGTGTTDASGDTTRRPRASRVASSSSTPGSNETIFPGDVCVRGLTLALSSIAVGERALVRVQPAYAYLHPNATREPPDGVDVEDELWLDVESLLVRDAIRIRTAPVGESPVGESPPGTTHGATHKVVVSEGDGWESPRPPFEVQLELTGNTPDGKERSFLSTRTVRCVSGDGTLPPGLSAAVDTMRVGERARVWCEPGTYLANATVCGVKVPGGNNGGVEFECVLESMVHARDVFGDGAVFKRRTTEGHGEFPADCPVHDCTCRVHFSVGLMNGDESRGERVYDTRCAEGETRGEPFEFQLGCGILPEALETSFRLAVPGEVSRVTLNDALHPKHGYVGTDQPGARAVLAAIGTNEEKVGLEFTAELVGFDRPVNWHNAPLRDMLREATKLKNEGNDLLAAGKLTLARVKYEKTVRNLESLRGLDDDEHDAVRDVKRKTLLNLAAALQRLGEHAGAIKSLEKLLGEDEDDAKALWRRSVSLLATHEYAAARADLNKCVESDPSTAEDVARQLRRVDEREESGVARERLVAERALG